MENNNEINKIVAKNLITYRKAAGFTQAELAEKINYSDKSISKWESGNGIPDVYTLIQLSQLFGVTVNDLVGQEARIDAAPKKQKASKGAQALIALLSSGIVWLVAILLFVVGQIVDVHGGNWWITFLYAILANFIVILVYACIWKWRVIGAISISAIIWISLTCVYITVRMILIQADARHGALWLIFLLGIPLQCLEIFWESFRALLRKQHRKAKELKKEEE